MKVFGRAITDDDMRNIAEYMDDDIRENLHIRLAPCSHEEFISAYLEEDKKLLEVLVNEFDFEM